MPALPIRSCLVAVAILAAPAAASAAPADCELAMLKAATVVDLGRRAAASQYYVEASDLATGARIPAIDAAHRAKACGCPEAIPFLADAALAAERTTATTFLTSMQQYGNEIRKSGEAAIAALQKCAAR
jgi:hypothetical protein